MNKLKAGDVVRLKSSGRPKMTCSQIKADGETVKCQWFVRHDIHGWTLNEGYFSVDSLELVQKG